MAPLTRRHLMLAVPCVAAAANSPQILDSHVHFYDPERPGGVPWPRPTERTLYRRVMPDDYRKISKADVIVVEASPLFKDNDWIFDITAKHSFVKGLVGNIDPASPDFAANLERYTANPKFLGIRLGVPKAADHIGKLVHLANANRTLDLIGDARMYPLAAQLAAKYPKLRIVLDHLPLAEPDPGIQALKPHKNVYAKVSWILRSGDDTLQRHREALDELMRVFGEDRVVYGSNWPVSDLIAPYQRIEDTAITYFKDKPLQKYLQLNSQAAYRWKR
ncbi:amidohydrolase [Bryobacterales bacterium F-183]|nr:amidohydrolase [Bryobacterales bacterium F-183]